MLLALRFSTSHIIIWICKRSEVPVSMGDWLNSVGKMIDAGVRVNNLASPCVS